MGTSEDDTLLSSILLASPRRLMHTLVYSSNAVDMRSSRCNNATQGMHTLLPEFQAVVCRCRGCPIVCLLLLGSDRCRRLSPSLFVHRDHSAAHVPCEHPQLWSPQFPMSLRCVCSPFGTEGEKAPPGTSPILPFDPSSPIVTFVLLLMMIRMIIKIIIKIEKAVWAIQRRGAPCRGGGSLSGLRGLRGYAWHSCC